MPALVPSPEELLGVWRLDRIVHDRRTGERHRVDGTTTLQPDGDGRISWTEAGVMRSTFGSTPVSRRLTIVRDDAGEWEVRFADGRLFHAWRPGRSVVHECSPDTYVGAIDTVQEHGGAVRQWRVTWDASGPAKDYRIESLLTREPS